MRCSRSLGEAEGPVVVGEVTMSAPAMLTRPIPSTGEALPVIGLGTWRAFDVGTDPATRRPLREVLQLLLDAGGRVIDISPMYGRAEAVTGDLLAELGARLGPAIAHRGDRPCANSQPRGLAYPSGDTAPNERGGEGALYRRHPLHD